MRTRSVRAAVLNTSPGDLDIEDLTLTNPGRDEVAVQVAFAGLCHSDLHEIQGRLPTETPIVLGHEASGIVVEIGDNVTGVSVGDHVVTCLSVFCGRCRCCASGHQTLCVSRSALALNNGAVRLMNDRGLPVRPTAGIGAFAEGIVVHQNALAVIPQDIPLKSASILGCAVVTGMGAVVRRAQVRPGSSVVVIGAGGVGMSAIQGAYISGASQVIAVDVVTEKLDLARHFGASHVVDATVDDAVEAVIELTRGGADYSFEAVGAAGTVEQAIAMLRPGGIATVVGVVPSDPPIRVNGLDLFYAEKTLQGSFMGTNRFNVDIPNYVELYRTGRLDLDGMITGTVSLDAINEGFAGLASGRGIRTIVNMAS